MTFASSSLLQTMGSVCRLHVGHKNRSYNSILDKRGDIRHHVLGKHYRENVWPQNCHRIQGVQGDTQEVRFWGRGGRGSV